MKKGNMNGYHGKILEVNLNDGTIKDRFIPEEFYKKFIGGATLAAALIYDQVEKGLNPLGPDNPLVFAVGPFTGTTIPMVSRYAVCAISPLTGYWGEATSGGSFPFYLKGTGYDGIIINGKAEKPTYLILENGNATLREASHLWGKDCYQTQSAIKEEINNKDVGIACIGEAGEKQLLYAGIVNDEGRISARTGMGAVMGSKNLKAVVAGGKLKPDIFDKKALTNAARQVVKEIRGNIISKGSRAYGTLFYMDMGMTLADTPAKYFTRSVFEAQKVTGHALKQNYIVENYACRGCPIGCGREIKAFSEDLNHIDGPEYETVGGFGPLCMNMDYDSIIKANDLCNKHGIDTISTSVSIAYAMYLYEKGVLTIENAGMEIKWGDGETILRLIEMIIRQEGIGKLLSKGTLRMANELGRDENEAAQVKGLELPMHDGRAFHGQAVSYATSPRGACHLKGDYYSIDLGSMIAEWNVLPGDRMSSEAKGESAAKYQSFKDLFDSLTLCKFAPVSVTQICEMINALTGWDFGPMDLLAAGNRSVTLKRAISNKFGVTQMDDKLPGICMTPLDEGASAGIVPDMELMLKEYYAYRGWDPSTGKPNKATLIELGLENVANQSNLLT